MATIISSSSINRERMVALKERKRLAREVEAALESKKQAEREEKKKRSDHRIATKMARINGTEPPAPLPVEKPVVVEPEVVEEPAAKTVAEQAPEVETKKPAKRTYKKRTKK